MPPNPNDKAHVPVIPSPSPVNLVRGLSPIRAIPPIRPISLRNAVPTISVSRPSTNLGNVLNGAMGNVARLAPHINITNPMPFDVLHPTSGATTSPHLPTPGTLGAQIRNLKDKATSQVAIGRRIIGPYVRARIPKITRTA